MGAINSKRKSIIKGIKRKKVRREQTTDTADEPVYEEIDLARDNNARNVSDGSYISVPSVDSAFCERTPTITPRSSSVNSLVYDEPEESLIGQACSKKLFDCYLSLNDVKADDDDDNDDDEDEYNDGDAAHTYISDMSLWETDSDNSSIKKIALSKNSRRFGRRRTSQVPLEEVPYMVEAFQPLLELTIDVTEVIPHLPFIESHEFINGDDARTKVNLLIEKIKSCNEHGKWQAFLHALNQAEYQYIVSLLRGETEEDHFDNRNLLKLFTPQIMDRIDPEEFIDHLFEKGVINERDKEEVRCEKDRRGAIAASFMLLHKVPRRVSNWFVVFLDVLEKCGMDDLIPQFNIPEVSIAKKRDQQNKQLDEDKYYLTPTCDNDDHIERTRRKLQCNGQLQNRSKRPFSTPISTRSQAPFNKSLSTRTQAPCFKPPLPPVPIPPMIIQPPRRQKTEIEVLKEEKESLQREIEEKILKRQYKKDVKALKLELEKLNSDCTDEEEDDLKSVEDTAVDEFANDVSNENIVVDQEILTEEIASKERLSNKSSDMVSMQFDIKDERGKANKNNEEMDKEANQIENISTLISEMKQELKNDILEMRDHVTEAVLKSVFGLISGSSSTEENGYALIDDGKTFLPHTVPLYNSFNKQAHGLLTPKSHIMQKHFSVDSAMFSDLSYVGYGVAFQ